MKLYPLVILAATFHLSTPVSVAAEDPSPFETLARATGCLESDNLEAVGEAYRNAGRFLSSPPPQSWVRLTRREKLIFCLRLLDGVQVATRNLGEVSAKGATLSVGVEGVPIAGMDPKHVADPAVRERYERAIADNARKLALLSAKALFQRLELIWTGHVQHVVKTHYDQTAEDRSEVNDLLIGFVSDASARSALRASLNLSTN